MTKNKTTYTNQEVSDFINTSVESKTKQQDSLELIAILESISSSKAKMWGTSIIGFGIYQYKYPSGHQGEAPLLAFSPRKTAISLYIYSDTEKSKQLLNQLGKFKTGKACIYINKLSDIRTDILTELCTETLQFIKTNYPQ